MTVLAVLQARLSSTRLPGKVLKDLAGAPMILRQIERVGRAGRIDRLVVATSTEASDDPLAQALAGHAEVFRGPLDDVLARFTGALAAYPADHVVRLTGDCPLSDPEVIDATVALHLESGADYTNNRDGARAWPKGLDVEVITADALRRAAAQAATPEEHEHVTWGLRHHDGWRREYLLPETDEGEVRWTVDRPDDYDFVRAIYEALYPANPAFTTDEVRALVRSRPDLATLGGDRRV